VAGHGDEAGFLRTRRSSRVGHRVGHRSDLDVLPGAHAPHGLLRVHLRRCGENRRVDARLGQALAEIRRPVGMPNLALDFFGSEPPASVATSMPGMLRIASMCLMPNAPCPATQIFMSLFCLERDPQSEVGRSTRSTTMTSTAPVSR
jgi:hypothetical protein